MSDLQKSLIDQSFKTLKVIEPKKIILSSVLYAVLGVAVAYFASKEWPSVDLIVLIFIIAFVYTIVRTLFLLQMTKRMIKTYYEYVLRLHPKADLFVPIMEKVGSNVIMKRAALFFAEDKLFMEAFKEQSLFTKPRESLTIEHGKDFFIKSMTVFEPKNVSLFQGTLANTDYNFALINHPSLNQRIQAFIKSPENKEV